MAAVSSMMLRSLRLTGEKARGDTLNSTEQVEVLAELNTFMDSCSIDRLYIPYLNQESFALAANTVSYTIGSGATFNTTRPTKLIDPCFTRDAASLDTPLTIISAEGYGEILQKNIGMTYPTKISYDQGMDASGFGTISIYPAPIAGLTLYINSWKQLQQFADVSTALAMPPGYQAFIESNFAMQLCAGYVEPSQALVKMARETRAAIKAFNAPSPVMELDAAIVANRRASNIITGP